MTCCIGYGIMKDIRVEKSKRRSGLRDKAFDPNSKKEEEHVRF